MIDRVLIDFESAPFEIIDGDRGKNYPKQNEFSRFGHCLFLSARNVTPRGFEFSDCQFISEEKDQFLRKGKLRRGDVVLTTRGTIGNSAYYGDSVTYDHVRINSGMVILRCDAKQMLPTYLYHFLRSPSFHDQVNSLRSGVAQPQLPISDMKRIKLPLPPVTEQMCIGAILSAYDELIENNLRRIKILEEMAQNLYREWFVKLRFPGHENARFLDSPLGKIPEGWKPRTLDDVLSELESGSRPKGGIDPGVRDVPSIGAENILGLGQYDYSKEKYVSREFFGRMRRGHIKSGDVLLYKDGAKIGRKSMFRDGFPHPECCINEHVFILRTNKGCTQSYLFFWLDQPDMTERIRTLNSNAAQPGINQRGVKGLPIVLPPSTILRTFDQAVEPLLAELFNLAKKNPILRRTRDLLLPKLISGELDVRDLDIEAGNQI